MHGPKSIVDKGFTVLALPVGDASERSIIEACDHLARQGARIFVTTDKNVNAVKLPFISAGHPLIDPILLIVSYYIFIENLERLKGLNPDEPPYLKKVTETV